MSTKFQKKSISEISRENFWVRFFFLGKNPFLSTEVEGEVFWNSVKTFDGFVRTAFYVSEKDFWVNCFFYEFLSFFIAFWLWEEHSATLAQKIWKICQNCILLEQKNFSGKLCFGEKKTYIYKFFELCLTSLPICGLLSKNLPNCLKNSFLHLFRRTSCITLSFSSRKCTLTNGICEKKLEFGKNFWTPGSKLLSPLGQWNFSQNFMFFVEKVYAFKRNLRENAQNSVTGFWHGGEICFLWVQKRFWRIFCLFH